MVTLFPVASRACTSQRLVPKLNRKFLLAIGSNTGDAAITSRVLLFLLAVT